GRGARFSRGCRLARLFDSAAVDPAAGGRWRLGQHSRPAAARPSVQRCSLGRTVTDWHGPGCDLPRSWLGVRHRLQRRIGDRVGLGRTRAPLCARRPGPPGVAGGGLRTVATRKRRLVRSVARASRFEVAILVLPSLLVLVLFLIIPLLAVARVSLSSTPSGDG